MTTEVPAATVAPAAAPANAAPATAAPEVKPEAQPPERTFTQKELDEIVEKRLVKERRKREEKQRESEYWRTAALEAKGQPKTAQPAKPAENAEPKRENFGTYEEFIEARADYRADRKVEERFARQREDEAKTRTASEQQKLMDDFRSNAAKHAKEIDDFEEVLSTSESMITQEMSLAMLHAGEIGPRIAYELAKNPEEAKRIAALPASRQAAEIGKMEMRLSTPQTEQKKPSKAPPPIKPVGGKEVAGDDMPDASDTKAWIAWRNRQIAARRKGT